MHLIEKRTIDAIRSDTVAIGSWLDFNGVKIDEKGTSKRSILKLDEMDDI